jgi:hypothetical protein
MRIRTRTTDRNGYRIPFGRSAAENEGKIKTDTLQRLHSVSNLAELLEAGHQGIPPTLRDSSLRYTAGGGAPGHPTHSQGLLPQVHPENPRNKPVTNQREILIRKSANCLMGIPTQTNMNVTRLGRSVQVSSLSLSSQRGRCSTLRLPDYRVQEFRLPSPLLCTVLLESLSVDSQNISWVTLKRSGSWVISIYLWIHPTRLLPLSKCRLHFAINQKL